MRRTVVVLTLLVALTSCLPARQTSKLTVAPTDAMRCAADTLASLGYRVTDERAADGVLQGERDQHVRVPYRGDTDFDRITVTLQAQDLRVIGETLHIGSPTHVGPQSAYEGQPLPRSASREVRDETKRIAETCSGS